jgi:large subunit ribosomal protein L10
MPTAQKERVIEQTRALYEKAQGLFFADYRGLKVHEMQALRAGLRAKGAELHVVKNTLFRRAAGEDIALLPEEFHNGPTAIAFVFENEAECAKALVDFTKTSKALEVKGGFLGGKAMTGAQVVELAKLPPRDVLIAQVIGAIAAPLTHLVGVIEALYADPIRTIAAVADKASEGGAQTGSGASPAEVAAPETAEQVAPIAEAEAEASPQSTEEATEASDAGGPTADAAEADDPTSAEPEPQSEPADPQADSSTE